jgi:hypothetical protein
MRNAKVEKALMAPAVRPARNRRASVPADDRPLSAPGSEAEAALAALRRDFTPRMRGSPQASAFTAMTAADGPRAPGGPAGLSQQQRELLAAQRLQEQLRNVR